ncbi:MAG: hypothetical protein ACTSUD_06980 [Alphaproteobacteria bacterium]
MIARRGSGWLAVTFLLGVCFALGAFVYDQARREPSGPAPSAGAGEAPPLATLPAQLSYSAAPMADYLAILERPLFSPNRRPPAEGVAAVASSQPQLQVTLVGVIISSEEKIAVVRLKDATSFARLSVGDSFQGWVLNSIEPSRITFQRGDVEEHIELTYDVPPPVQKPKRRKRRERKKSAPEPAQGQPTTE